MTFGGYSSALAGVPSPTTFEGSFETVIYQDPNTANNRAAPQSSQPGDVLTGEIYTVNKSVSGSDTTGVFRPSNGLLYLKNTNITGFADVAINYGAGRDYPVAGDWDGNGTDTIGVYRNGVFYLRNSNTIGYADIVFAFGTPGNQPVAGDWNGDGIDTIGVYNSSAGSFYLRNSNSAGSSDMNFSLGNPGDVGIAGDWNGDGVDTTGVFRPNNGALYLKNTNTTGFADIAINYGISGDQPVTGDWDNNGTDTIGVYRKGTFYLRNSNTIGAADLVFTLGNPGDMPISGSWGSAPNPPSMTYYVSPTGNDANAGTLASPFKTIQKGISVIGLGGTLYVRSGTYPSFSVTKSGTANNYITISAYNNEKPVISGGSTGIRLSGVSYIAIKGFEVIQSTGTQSAIFLALNSNHNVIEGNIVHDNPGGSGIMIEAGSYNKIINNIVYNNFKVGLKIRDNSLSNELIGNAVYHHVGDPPNSDGIAISGINTKYTLVKNNIIYDNADDGIDTWDSSYNTVVGNVVHNQRGVGDGNGIKLGGTATGGHNTVIGNISYNNKRDGFDSNHSGGNAYYNNVAFGNGNVGFEDVAKFAGSDPSTYVNNIGYDNARNFSASKFTAVSHNNIWYSDSGSANISYEGSPYATLASFFVASGNRLDNPDGGALASLQVNPQFVNASAGVFTLQSLSPAIDKGDSSNPGRIIAVNLVDMGAVEYGASGTSIIPQGSLPTQSNIPTVVPAVPTDANTPTAVPASPTQTNAPTGIPATPTQTDLPVPTATLTASDLIFTDGFEVSDLSAWSSSTTDANDLSVTSAAALQGGYGLQALIDDGNKIFVSDDRPNAEPHYQVRFYFDPNSITMLNGEDFYIFQGYISASAAVLKVKFIFSNGSYQLKASLLNDDTTWTSSSSIPISDSSQFIELDWQAATAVGANNGSLTVWVNGVQQASLTGVDNDTQRMDSVQLGAVTGIDPGTRGIIFLDALESHRQTYIGP
jgi:parallel beta-helix repeat protein